MHEQVEIAIVGGGMAGSLLAALLARAGHRVVLCDLHETYPPDFRAEKLSPPQIASLEALGFGEALHRAATPVGELAIARFGRIVQRRPSRELAIDYPDLVACARTQVPPGAMRLGRVTAIDPAEPGASVRFSDGRTIAARLVVVATGLARGLVEGCGFRRRLLDPEHCLAIGFDVAPADRGAARTALTYHGQHRDDRSAYLTLFPLGDRLRANLFVYRRHGEDWAAAFRARPAETLRAMMPGLAPILGEFEVSGRVVTRPIALHVTEDPVRDGVVLIGDAFATTCPTGGVGLDKVLTDVERLVALVPGWLAANDTSAAATARFYADPAKRACDAEARRRDAYARGMALDPGLTWTARRWRNFLVLVGLGWLRRALPTPLPNKVSASHRG